MNLDPALIKQLVPGTLNRSTINEQPVAGQPIRVQASNAVQSSFIVNLLTLKSE
ncbi:hypothetical protein QZM81_26600 [Burkholderia cepacia]|uniref:hypothetical protein n=1 Tax=Burkholderia cepacia TaxID=292 RepID=UPI00264E4E1D|nr:hypothetical protein [Burkholderia cepacia]MDN7859377.1 hypothetical protein [Burkholderia cepacia]